MSNNNENKLVPMLRFPEFTDIWETEQLSNILDYERPDNYIVEDTNYISEGIPVLTANKSFILGYTQETFGICTNIPAIIFDDFTVDKKFVDFPFKVKSSAIKILRPKGKNDLKFIFELMSLIRFEAKEHKRYYISAYQNLTVPIPKPAEQQKIAACLSSLDEVITAESKKLEALKEHKKGLLQNLFPQQGETVPKLRFKEFEESGEWVEKTLDDICKFIRGPFGGALKKEIFVREGHAVYEQSHAIYADFTSFRYFITEEKYNELKRFAVQPNDIIMSCSGTMGKFAIIPEHSKKGVINQALLKLSVKAGNDITFVKASLELPLNQNKLLSQSAGGAIKNVVEVSQIKEIKISIPSLSEQQKIAACLSSLDELITAQTQKIELLQWHKKGLLQGLFPNINEQNG